MPEYLAKIRNKTKGINVINKKIIASSHSDAEKIIEKDLVNGQYLESLDNISFGQDFSVRK